MSCQTDRIHRGKNQRAMSSVSMDSFPCRIKPELSSSNDTIYLCNFRVSVDGDWLCLKELHDLQSCEFSSRPALLREDYGLYLFHDGVNLTNSSTLENLLFLFFKYLFNDRFPWLYEAPCYA